MRFYKIILLAITVMIFGMLSGCLSGTENAVKENSNTEQAVSIVEDYLKRKDPSYKAIKSSFKDVEAELRKGSSEKTLTDWVTGEYEGVRKENVLVNVKSREIYTSENWDKVNAYCIDLANKLYGVGDSNVQVTVIATTYASYFADTEKYGNITITNMLSAETDVNDEYLKSFMSDGKYRIKYIIRISDEVDINTFKKNDHSVLGNRVSIHVEQYSKSDYLSMISSDKMPEPIETYDSE